MKAAIGVLFVLLVASSAAAQGVPPACQAKYKTLAPLVAAANALKAACPAGAPKCSPKCKLAMKKVRTVGWRAGGRQGLASGAQSGGRRVDTWILWPACAPCTSPCPQPPSHLHHMLQASLQCWQQTLTPFGPAAVGAVTAGYKTCGLTRKLV